MKVEQFKTIDPSKTNIVMVGASWCGPCKAFKPRFEKYADDSMKTEVFQYAEIDSSDEASSFSKAHALRSVPTIVVVEKTGTTVMTVREFENWISK